MRKLATLCKTGEYANQDNYGGNLAISSKVTVKTQPLIRIIFSHCSKNPLKLLAVITPLQEETEAQMVISNFPKVYQLIIM